MKVWGVRASRTYLHKPLGPIRFSLHQVFVGWVAVVFLLVSAPELRFPLLLGMGMFALLWRSRYRDGFLWFSALPGLLHFTGSPPSWELAWVHWFQTTLVLWIFGTIAGNIQRNMRWALWPGLGLLALLPSGGLLGWLLVLHLLWGLVRELRLTQSLGRPFWLRPAGLVALGLVCAAVGVGFGSLSMKPLLFGSSPALVQPMPTAPAGDVLQAPGPSAPAVRWVRPAGSALEPWLPRLDQVLNGLQMVLLLVLALVLILVFWGHRAKRRASGGSFLLPVLAVTLTWAVLLAGLRGGAGGEGFALPQGLEGPGLEAQGWLDRPVPPGFTETGYLLAALMAGLGFLMLLGLLYLAWRLQQTEASQPKSLHPHADAAIPYVPLQDPIREAYRRFEQQMGRLGWPRPPFASPSRYVDGLTRERPEDKASLQRLLELYQQVRYGGRRLAKYGDEAMGLAEELPRRFYPS